MTLNPGALAIGVVTGIGSGFVLALPILAVGWDASSVGGQAVLIIIGLGAQFLAGYVAARLVGRDHELHGGIAALALFGVVAAVALAAAREPSIATLAVGAVTALVMGTIGGVLAHSRVA